jgi:hypothetical protein
MTYPIVLITYFFIMIICQSFLKIVFHDDFAEDYIEWWLNEFSRKFQSE